MNKYILADMVTEKLKKEIGMVAKPLPEELRIMEGELPSGRVRFENTLYQAGKLKKITIGNHTLGETGAGSLVMIVADDDYDLPFIVVDIAFDSGAKGEIFTEFEAKPLVKDEESTQKYVEPFRKWREALGKLPAEAAPGDIFIDIYRKAEPVKDIERRRKMQAFRAEYNKHVLEEDPSGVMLMNVFGRKTAELFYDYLLYL